MIVSRNTKYFHELSNSKNKGKKRDRVIISDAALKTQAKVDLTHSVIVEMGL